MDDHPTPESNHGLRPDIPPAALHFLAEARHALSQRQPELAKRALARVMEIAPMLGDAWRMMGATQRMLGHHRDAAVSLRRAIEINPDEPMTHLGLGIALHHCGELDDALAEFGRACQLAPESAPCWFNLGNALKLRGHHAEKACEALERALSIDPGHIAARLTLAEAQTMLGNGDAAIANYRDILRRQPSNHQAWLGLAGIKNGSFTEHDARQLVTLVNEADPSTDAGIMLGFALSRAMEDQDDYSAAFASLATANASKRRLVDWSTTSEKSYVDAIQRAFAQPRNPEPATDRGSEIIFIISLPRSGSTLVEQVLASHPQVEGGGEILDLQQVLEGESVRRDQSFPQWADDASAADWARLGEEYLQRTASLRSDSPRSTDKNLLNWKLVGPALAMLPGARFVNIRRDPLETCLACFRQLFRTGNGFSYDLDDMASYWQLYDGLCRHWQQLYPRRILDIQYEALVDEPEAVIRRLLDFCGLAFDPACLDFHETQREIRTASAAQVRQPLRRNTAPGPSYGDALAPLRLLLGNKMNRGPEKA